MFSGDKQTVARSSERGAGDKGEHRFFGFVDKSGDIGWLDDLAFGHLVSVTNGFIVDI